MITCNVHISCYLSVIEAAQIDKQENINLHGTLKQVH